MYTVIHSQLSETIQSIIEIIKVFTIIHINVFKQAQVFYKTLERVQTTDSERDCQFF